MTQTVSVQGDAPEFSSEQIKPQGPQDHPSEEPVDWKAKADEARRLLRYPDAWLETEEQPWEQTFGTMHYEGTGVGQDFKEALKWYTVAAANQGNVEAQFALAVMYHFGRGVIVQDYEVALKWYCRAASQGDPNAQFNIGTMCARGEGVPKNPAEAARWYELAAKQDYPSAQFNLGCLYHDGVGVIQDMKAARKWLTLAAENGEFDAQFNLGCLYLSGIGIKQNLLYAYAWFNIAASSGAAATGKVEEAGRTRDAIAKELTLEQLEKAQKMTRSAMNETSLSSYWKIFLSMWRGKRWWNESLS